MVLEGSGRLADVIANVAGLPMSNITIAFIERLMKRFFAEEYETFSELKIIEWTKKVGTRAKTVIITTVSEVFCGK